MLSAQAPCAGTTGLPQPSRSCAHGPVSWEREPGLSQLTHLPENLSSLYINWIGVTYSFLKREGLVPLPVGLSPVLRRGGRGGGWSTSLEEFGLCQAAQILD